MRRLTGALLLSSSLVLCAVPARAETPIPTSPAADEFQAAFEKKDWPQAVQAAKTMAEQARPGDVFALYYLAAAHARAGQREESLRALGECVDRGWFQAVALERDADFESIRAAPEFASALDKARRSGKLRLERYSGAMDGLRLAKSYPRDYSATTPTPLIVALHGLGSSGAEIDAVWRKAADEVGAILISPTSPHASQLQQFEWRSVEEAEAIVLKIVDPLTDSLAVDPSKVVLTGFSQGAALAIAIALRHPERFAGVVPVCGVFDPNIVSIPRKPMPAIPRFAILNGRDDDEALNNRAATQLLYRLRIPVQLRLYPGLAHEYPRDRDAELRSVARFALGIPDDRK